MPDPPPSPRPPCRARSPRSPSPRCPSRVMLTASSVDAAALQQVGQQHLRRRAGRGHAGDAPLQVADRGDSAGALRRRDQHQTRDIGASSRTRRTRALRPPSESCDRKSLTRRRRCRRPAPAAPSRRRRSPGARRRALPLCRTRAPARASSADRPSDSGRRPRADADPPHRARPREAAIAAGRSGRAQRTRKSADEVDNERTDGPSVSFVSRRRRHAFHRSNHRSSRDTPALTITTTTPRTVMPAKTPVVSNVPSA